MVVIVVVVVAMALLIHGCEAGKTRNSLKDYAASVYSLINRSDRTGATMFKELKAASSTSQSTLQTELDTVLSGAKSELEDTENLSVPGQMSTAQEHLVLVMQLRAAGIGRVASNIQEALSTTTSQDGVDQIAIAGSNLYASDNVYKTFVGPEIAGALNGAGIAVGGSSGVQINPGQITPDLGWMIRTNIAAWIGAKLPTTVANTAAPGLHGHSLNEVTVGTQTLSTVSTNTIPATPAPTFELNITNGGDFDEYDVECEVQVIGLSDTGTSTLAETTPGQTTDCSVTLPSPPTAGTYRVKAEVEPVPGEKNTANNVLTFPVTFTG